MDLMHQYGFLGVLHTLLIAEILSGKNARAWVSMDFTQDKFWAPIAIEKIKILGAFWELPAKQHCQSSPFSPKVGCIGCAIQQATSKGLPGFFFRFNILILIHFFKYKTIETHARAFMRLNISAVGSVISKICANVCFRQILNLNCFEF